MLDCVAERNGEVGEEVSRTDWVRETIEVMVVVIVVIVLEIVGTVARVVEERRRETRDWIVSLRLVVWSSRKDWVVELVLRCDRGSKTYG